MRLYFATDLHGSETCWRKFLNAGQHYKADVIVLGGDMTGKALVPVIDDGGGHWHATLLENRTLLEGEEQVAAFENAVVRRGYYPFRATPEDASPFSRWYRFFCPARSPETSATTRSPSRCAGSVFLPFSSRIRSGPALSIFCSLNAAAMVFAFPARRRRK